MRIQKRNSFGLLEKLVILSLSILILMSLSIELNAGPKKPAVNIMDYAGKVVKGDYTEAIRTAIAQAVKTRAHKIYFPPGTYTISDTINMNSADPIGKGVTIVQSNPKKDIFYADKVWQRTIKGFSFIGGRDQIAIGNKNVDQGFLVISDCKFKNASGAAIRFLKKAELETASTYCLVEKCHFSNCIQSLISVSDQTTFRDSWISTSRKNTNNLAVIENYGNLKCENILGVPRVSSTDQRWIDNYGSLICNYFRFGGEGAGFTPIVNYTGASKALFGSYVILENSFVAALGNNKRACAVYCEKIPNMIVVKNCNLAGVPAVKVSAALNLKSYFNDIQPGMLRYSIAENIGEFAGSLPKEMLAAAVKRTIKGRDYGKKQLSYEKTIQLLKKLQTTTAKYPAGTVPLMMSYQMSKGEKGHKQQLKGYIEINPQAYKWSLDDYLDGVTELNSDYLAFAQFKDDVIIINRIEKGRYPHIRIKNIKVNLDKTPYLTWKFKDVGENGGHVAVKVIDKASGKQAKLMEDYYSNQAGYFAYDLREFFKKKKMMTLDIKLYLCGSRIVAGSGKNNSIRLNKGDWMLLDFMRLEPDSK